MRLTVFGVGYVGLVTGTGLAELGHEVLCVDVNKRRVEALDRGEMPLYEPGLSDLVRRNVRANRLSFAASVSSPFEESDVYFIAVGTPRGEDGHPNLEAVFEAARSVVKTAKKPALVAVKSTVPVGTCDHIQTEISGANVRLEVVSNPEFLKEGAAVTDFFRPDRIVLGADSESAQRVLRNLYAPLQLSGERVLVTDRRSSELIKYAANAMLAMRVSFMNELARLCDATGADIHAVRLGVGSDARIGKRFLFAGPGYGGSCFPKDILALTALGRAHGVAMRLTDATHQANEDQLAFVIELVRKACGELKGKRIAVWGLAYKPETDDVREAPSQRIVAALMQSGATVVGHDPEATTNFVHAMKQRQLEVKVEGDSYDAANGADAVLLLTEWRSYRAPNFGKLRERMRGERPLVIDARNVWRADEVEAAGLVYRGLGTRSKRIP